MDKKDLPIKKQIIETTKKLLVEKGNITIKEIADAAYVNAAAINYHFKTKDNLIQIVIEEVVTELREKIVDEIKRIDSLNLDFEEIAMVMIEIIFDFAEKNVGIISYSFLQMASQSSATNVLAELFIFDQNFISTVLGQIAQVAPGQPEEVLLSKYLIIFSSFVVPFFLSFSGMYTFYQGGAFLDNEKNFFARYKPYYLGELSKLLIS